MKRRVTRWLAALRGWVAGRRRPEARTAEEPPRAARAPGEVTEPGAPPEEPASAAWIPPGAGPIDIAGATIAGGMIYVGEHLPPVAEPYEVEPALIDPRLPVDHARPARRGEAMSCWPAYRDLSPQHRAAYLAWLAGGRRDPEADIGYVFLFLYGLERRLLADARSARGASMDAAERAAIEAEILGLLACYGRSASFRGYATGLLGAMWMEVEGAAPVYERLPPPAEPRAGELPLLLRLGLGQLLRDGRPIPAEWALAWALAEPEPPRSQRSPQPAEPVAPLSGRSMTEEQRARFRARYAEAFGEGLVRRAEGRELCVHYRPASASFGGGLVLTARGVPDVAPLREPVERIRQVLERE